MYLVFKNLKISRKEGHEQLNSKKQSSTDVFGGWSSRKNVHVMSIEVEMHKVTSR